MKILQISDLHIGKTLNEYSLLSDQQEILDYIYEVIHKNGVDVVAITGDIYDKSIPSTQSLVVFENFISKIILEQKKKVIIISGNHDQALRLSSYSNILKDNNLYFSKVFDKELEKIEIDEHVFYLFPFTTIHFLKQNLECDFIDYDQAIEYILKNTKLDKTKKNILLMHDYVGSTDKIITSDSEKRLYIGGSLIISDKLFKDFDYVLVGHLHTYQCISNNIYYSGSIMKYSFSEAKSKKYVVLYDTSSSNVSKIELPIIRDLVVLEGEIDDLLDSKTYTKYNYKNDFFKVILTNKEEVIDAFNKLRRIYPNLLELSKELSYEINKDIVINKLDVKDNLKGFFKDIYNYELSNKEEDILISILNKEIEE